MDKGKKKRKIKLNVVGKTSVAELEAKAKAKKLKKAQVAKPKKKKMKPTFEDFYLDLVNNEAFDEPYMSETYDKKSVLKAQKEARKDARKLYDKKYTKESPPAKKKKIKFNVTGKTTIAQLQKKEGKRKRMIPKKEIKKAINKSAPKIKAKIDKQVKKGKKKLKLNVISRLKKNKTELIQLQRVTGLSKAEANKKSPLALFSLLPPELLENLVQKKLKFKPKDVSYEEMEAIDDSYFSDSYLNAVENSHEGYGYFNDYSELIGDEDNRIFNALSEVERERGLTTRQEQKYRDYMMEISEAIDKQIDREFRDAYESFQETDTKEYTLEKLLRVFFEDNYF